MFNIQRYFSLHHSAFFIRYSLFEARLCEILFVKFVAIFLFFWWGVLTRYPLQSFALTFGFVGFTKSS